jgi:hypothetical protein
MTEATTFVSAPSSSTTSRGVGAVFRILPAALVLLAACGLVAITMLDRGTDVTAAPRLVPPAPTAIPTVATTGDTSVPDASAVFTEVEVEIEIEEPAPTF